MVRGVASDVIPRKHPDKKCRTEREGERNEIELILRYYDRPGFSWIKEITVHMSVGRLVGWSEHGTWNLCCVALLVGEWAGQQDKNKSEANATHQRPVG